jgi:hypothetical protein
VAAFDSTAGKIKLIGHTVTNHVQMTDTPVSTGSSGIRMDASQSAYVLRLEARYLGLGSLQSVAQRSGGLHVDAPAIPERIRLRFAQATAQGDPGVALTTAELNASVEKILIVRESTTSSTATFDAADIIVAEATPVLSSGYLTVTMPLSHPEYDEFSASYSTTRYQVALKMKPSVSAQTTGRFFVQHVTMPILLGSRFVTKEGLPARRALSTTGTPTEGQLVRITTPYEQWRMAYFDTYEATGPAWHNSDPDKDGMDNITEYVLRKNPKQAEAGFTNLSFAPAFDSTMLLVDLPVTPREDGIVTVQQSTSLQNWTTFAQRTGSGAWTGVAGAVLPYGADLTRSIFETPAGDRRMYRLTYSVAP